MTTPAKPSDVTTPAAAAYQPVPLLAPTGWVVVLSTALLVVFSTWFIYGLDADGMWAGYRGGMVGTAVVLATFALRTRTSPVPWLVTIGLGGALLLLFALVYNDGTRVFVTEVGGGALILLGAAMIVAGRREG